MKLRDLLYQARVSAEILREDYGVPVHRATVLQYAALGAAIHLQSHNIEVTGVHVTNELIAGDELGIRIETDQMLIDIQACPKEDRDIVSELNEKYGSPEAMQQAIENDYKETQ